MKPAPIPEDEAERLKALDLYDILDTLPEKEYDDLVAVASYICGTPIALVSLIDSNRQWFKARVGLKATETPRDVSFCGHVVANRDMLVVPDATKDERFADNPLVTGGPHVRFYAGAPLVTPDQHYLGTLCVIDEKPRELNAKQQAMLKALARQVVLLLDLRIKYRELAAADERMKQQLNQAAVIQQSLLPTRDPVAGKVVFSWKYRPCNELGGDILNIIPISSHRFGLYLLDVSGHGVDAALFSSALCHVLSRDGGVIASGADQQGNLFAHSPGDVVRRLNQRFRLNTDTLQYFTIVYGILDTAARSFTYCSAGHPGPALVRKDGGTTILPCQAPAVGLSVDVDFGEHRVELAPGDRVYLYCDGIVEARNDKGEMLEEEGLLACLRESSSLSLTKCTDSIIERVAGWTEGEQQDDISILAFEIQG